MQAVRPMSGRTRNSDLRALLHAHSPMEQRQLQRIKGVERVEDPSWVQGNALPAGGLHTKIPP